MAEKLNPGESLTPGQALSSIDGRYALHMQVDGNLVLYGPSGPFWSTETNGKSVTQAVMQTDGNFVLYDSTGAVFNTATDGNPGAWIQLQNDGNLVVYNHIWEVTF